MSTVVRLFPNTHMAFSHHGLIQLAEKSGISVEKMAEDDLLLFINRPQTAMKILDSRNVIIYFRHPQNHRIDQGIFKLLPWYIKGGKLDYKGAMKERLKKMLRN